MQTRNFVTSGKRRKRGRKDEHEKKISEREEKKL